MGNLGKQFRVLLQYPSAISGLVVIVAFIGLAVYTMITIPYDQAISLWRGSEGNWYQNPKLVPPVWYNWFTPEDLPASFSYSTTDPDDVAHVTKTVTPKANGEGSDIVIVYDFNFNADVLPQAFSLYLKSDFESKNPFVSMTWLTPDGRELRIADFGAEREQNYRFDQDTKLRRRLRVDDVTAGLLKLPDTEDLTPQKGDYQLKMEVTTFEPDSDIHAEFIMYGLVYGWAGTDHMRRDLMLPLMWGAPIALAFGFVAALGTSVLTMIIAAVGAWYGGWIDELIQRITEVNLVLPFLSILIMVGTFYSRSIWVILGVTILLSIFTGGIKGYRAIFLQVKESTYIEAARAYGAGNARIIFLYLLPRIIPLLIPGLVSSIPAFVFLEASLAVLGLGDPVLPTWGKIINDAQNNGALYQGLYYWILEPAVLLMVTGLGFAVLGYSLDRVFNPRLRGL